MCIGITGVQNITDFCVYKSISMKARAKINLSLDVTSQRSDGYHDIKTIMQTINLHDNIIIDVIDNGIELECNSMSVPHDCKNIAYKAAELFISEFNIKSGVRIKIDKNIPVAAGLAGGSSDAAAVLIGMNKLFNCGIDVFKLISIGKLLGADIPYCIKGGTVLAKGIGDILKELKEIPVTYVVLVVPKVLVSTKWVYQNIDINKINIRPDMDLLLSAISEGNITLLAENMVNVLETVTIEKFEIINTIKQKLKEFGALGSLMSGSGPSVFGLFKDKNFALEAYRKIKCNDWYSFVTETT